MVVNVDKFYNAFANNESLIAGEAFFDNYFQINPQTRELETWCSVTLFINDVSVEVCVKRGTDKKSFKDNVSKAIVRRIDELEKQIATLKLTCVE